MKATIKIEGVPANIGAKSSTSSHEISIDIPQNAGDEWGSTLRMDLKLLNEAFAVDDGFLEKALNHYGNKEFIELEELLNQKEISEFHAVEKGGGVVLVALAVATMVMMPFAVR